MGKPVGHVGSAEGCRWFWGGPPTFFLQLQRFFFLENDRYSSLLSRRKKRKPERWASSP